MKITIRTYIKFVNILSQLSEINTRVIHYYTNVLSFHFFKIVICLLLLLFEFGYEVIMSPL